jgi:hypothetical protein
MQQLNAPAGSVTVLHVADAQDVSSTGLPLYYYVTVQR